MNYMNNSFKVGDKVRLRQHKAWLRWSGKTHLGLKWRYPMPGKPQEFGFVVQTLGPDVICVRPRWKPKDFVMELYAGELDHV